MFRILVRSIANIGKLIKNVRNVPLKANTLTSCNVKCVPSMMFHEQLFGRNYATNAEKSLAEHLEGEIKLGKEHFEAPSDEVGEFNVQKLDGANVELFRKYNDEKITIKFNINGTLEHEKMPESDEEDYLDLVSKPSFTIEINKGKEKNLVIELGFISSEVKKDGQNFDILSFAFAKNGVVDNTTYSSFAQNMDLGQEIVDDVHNDLTTMLKERGVDQSFANELQEWATSYDKKLYLDVLGDLNKHVL